MSVRAKRRWRTQIFHIYFLTHSYTPFYNLYSFITFFFTGIASEKQRRIRTTTTTMSFVLGLRLLVLMAPPVKLPVDLANIRTAFMSDQTGDRCCSDGGIYSED